MSDLGVGGVYGGVANGSLHREKEKRVLEEPANSVNLHFHPLTAMNIPCTVRDRPNHPWLYSALKRKRDRSPAPDQAALADPDSEQAIAAKRRRQRAIENGLASLSLDECSALQSLASPSTTSPSLLPEVQMKSSSWYEPEKDRIVVLDLDSDDESLSETGWQPEGEPGFLVSSAVLARLKNVTPNKNDLPKSVDPTSKALVVFMPSPWASPTPPASKSLPPASPPPNPTVGQDPGDDTIMMDIDP
ncbi:hypothetical protein BS47DRAFT_1352613 [Hydnum rufescens UP504]|uniref:Uncharacterized protein n=1 Tax=Hydnum rufescens UP504 TaxID=1448309 RepID=A0A9P6AIT6_9AGAM|nr:hypothetical protein BS47DRAFT_1352613 [Hydnum rufescens UP504]